MWKDRKGMKWNVQRSMLIINLIIPRQEEWFSWVNYSMIYHCRIRIFIVVFIRIWNSSQLILTPYFLIFLIQHLCYLQPIRVITNLDFALKINILQKHLFHDKRSTVLYLNLFVDLSEADKESVPYCLWWEIYSHS